ncbi:MAG: aminotransferase class I/II-fold pyridoxal phosphate-dependent enzyme [Bacteroidota bacterium]|nr:aminotransferase class I/II-fold pyridoxal phosphate-dependent enzyme [Bacteroidota bacterium]
MKDKIWLSSPHMGGNELKFVNEAFDTNWVAPLGPNVDGFEQDIASYLNSEVHVAALSSGTAAIHLALILLGIEKGDEVICQSMTFSASANPICYLGATPIFVDSETDTWNMSPIFLEEAIKHRMQKGKKPKAIIVVHLYGMPAKMDKIISIAKKYEIPVIEDAAEALGSSINNKKCGTFGDIGILSFNGNKIITTSGGGALVSKDKNYVKQAMFLSTQARDIAPHYQHSHIGYNYRMSNICAGIGRGQMEVLPERIRQRRANFYFYEKMLQKIEGISFLQELPGFFSNRWLTTLLIDSSIGRGITREDIRLKLEKDNIEARPLWKPMHLQPIFKNCPYYGENIAELLFNNGLCLPSGSNLLKTDLVNVQDSIRGLFDS